MEMRLAMLVMRSKGDVSAAFIEVGVMGSGAVGERTANSAVGSMRRCPPRIVLVWEMLVPLDEGRFGFDCCISFPSQRSFGQKATASHGFFRQRFRNTLAPCELIVSVTIIPTHCH